MQENYESLWKDSVTWLEEQAQEKLETDLVSLLRSAILSSKRMISPFYSGRIVHFDQDCAKWVRNRRHKKVPLNTVLL